MHDSETNQDLMKTKVWRNGKGRGIFLSQRYRVADEVLRSTKDKLDISKRRNQSCYKQPFHTEQFISFDYALDLSVFWLTFEIPGSTLGEDSSMGFLTK